MLSQELLIEQAIDSNTEIPRDRGQHLVRGGEIASDPENVDTNNTDQGELNAGKLNCTFGKGHDNYPSALAVDNTSRWEVRKKHPQPGQSKAREDRGMWSSSASRKDGRGLRPGYIKLAQTMVEVPSKIRRMKSLCEIGHVAELATFRSPNSLS